MSLFPVRAAASQAQQSDAINNVDGRVTDADADITGLESRVDATETFITNTGDDGLGIANLLAEGENILDHGADPTDAAASTAALFDAQVAANGRPVVIPGSFPIDEFNLTEGAVIGLGREFSELILSEGGQFDISGDGTFASDFTIRGTQAAPGPSNHNINVTGNGVSLARITSHDAQYAGFQLTGIDDFAGRDLKSFNSIYRGINCGGNSGTIRIENFEASSVSVESASAAVIVESATDIQEFILNGARLTGPWPANAMKVVNCHKLRCKNVLLDNPYQSADPLIRGEAFRSQYDADLTVRGDYYFESCEFRGKFIGETRDRLTHFVHCKFSDPPVAGATDLYNLYAPGWKYIFDDVSFEGPWHVDASGIHCTLQYVGDLDGTAASQQVIELRNVTLYGDGPTRKLVNNSGSSDVYEGQVSIFNGTKGYVSEGTVVPDGSLTDLALRFASDADTGIYRVSADDWAIVAGGVILMRFNASRVLMSDAKDIVLNATTGTRIGTSATQKLGRWGSTPVVRPAAIPDTSGADVAALEVEVNKLKAHLRAVGDLTP